MIDPIGPWAGSWGGVSGGEGVGEHLPQLDLPASEALGEPKLQAAPLPRLEREVLGLGGLKAAGPMRVGV